MIFFRICQNNDAKVKYQMNSSSEEIMNRETMIKLLLSA